MEQMEIQVRTAEGSSSTEGRLPVIMVQEESNKIEYCSPEELFVGFDHLKVLTYSLGLPFVSRVLHSFDDCEIVIGSPSMVSMDAAEVMAAAKLGEEMAGKDSYLIDRARKGSLRIYVAQAMMNHAKLFLLSSDEGHYRVIAGSANFSGAAFSGNQTEIIMCFQGEEYYDLFYRNYFEMVRDLAADVDFVKKGKVIKKDDPVDNPIMRAVCAKGAVVIEEGNAEEKEYLITIEKISGDIRKFIPKTLKHNEQGGTLISTEDLKVIRKKQREEKARREEKEKKMIRNPPFLLDYDEKMASFNGVPFDLSPSMEDVACVIRNNVLPYMDNYKYFIGDTKVHKRTMWKVFNYVFLSPFISHLRYLAYITKAANIKDFPNYCMILGSSEAGKTWMMRFMQHLMFEIDYASCSAPNKDFTKENALWMNENLKGIPVVVEEIDGHHSRTISSMVKSDEGRILRDDNNPAFILLSNSVESFDKSVGNRAFMVFVSCSRDSENENAQGLERTTRKLIDTASNALYREYLRRMFEEMEALEEKMRTGNFEQNWTADPFRISSQTLHQIFRDCGIDIPEEFAEFSHYDYSRAGSLAEEARSRLVSRLELAPRTFYPERRSNTLKIEFTETQSEKRNLNYFKNCLPERVQARTESNYLISKLDETEKFLGRKIKRPWFRK